MIYCNILGRMGNQMFSYALARKIQMEYRPYDQIALDLSDFDKNRRDASWRNYLTEFRCAENVVEERKHMSIVQRFLLRLFYSGAAKRQLGYSKELCEYEKKWAPLLSRFGLFIYTLGYYPYKSYKTSQKNIWLAGYFESARYFDGIRKTLIEDFKPIDELPAAAVQLVAEIGACHSVCLNVRRGDFTDKKGSEFLLVCTEKYYEKAAKIVKEQDPSAHFFVFSDDISWCKDNLRFLEGCTFVSNMAYGLTPQQQMHVMTFCQKFIISNSTFSWWAAYLCERKGKVVYAPSRWRRFNEELYSDIYEDDWILIAED